MQDKGIQEGHTKYYAIKSITKMASGLPFSLVITMEQQLDSYQIIFLFK